MDTMSKVGSDDPDDVDCPVELAAEAGVLVVVPLVAACDVVVDAIANPETEVEILHDKLPVDSAVQLRLNGPPSTGSVMLAPEATVAPLFRLSIQTKFGGGNPSALQVIC
jgi:hypothetical protein